MRDKKDEPTDADRRLPRHLYIAGDDGNYYRISERELRAFRVKPDDPNVEILKTMTECGVASAGLHKRQIKKIAQKPRHAQCGMFAMICAMSVHYVNLKSMAPHDDED